MKPLSSRILREATDRAAYLLGREALVTLEQARIRAVDEDWLQAVLEERHALTRGIPPEEEDIEPGSPNASFEVATAAYRAAGRAWQWTKRELDRAQERGDAKCIRVLSERLEELDQEVDHARAVIHAVRKGLVL
jgi:hypothetical protein